MTTSTTSSAASDTKTGVRIRRQLPSFAIIGVASGAAYIVLYALLRDVVSSYLANTLALAITAVGNTALNRHYTFGVRDADAAERLMHQVKGGVAFVIGLAVSNGALLGLHAIAAAPPHWVELSVLMLANLVATASRFLLMRVWVFRHKHSAQSPTPSPTQTEAPAS